MSCVHSLIIDIRQTFMKMWSSIQLKSGFDEEVDVSMIEHTISFIITGLYCFEYFWV